MKKYLISVLALMALGTGANAACDAKACNDKIERLFITANGNVYVATKGNEAKLGCTLAYGKYMKLSVTSPAQKSMYSALLTAQTTGANALIRIVDNDSACEIQYVTIDKK